MPKARAGSETEGIGLGKRPFAPKCELLYDAAQQLGPSGHLPDPLPPDAHRSTHESWHAP